MGQGAIDYIGVKGGLKLNDVIEEFKYVYKGQEIKAGDFVNYINGASEIVDFGTSEDIALNSGTGVSYPEMSAIELDNNRVFIVHGYGSDHHLYGMVVTINGNTITTGTDTVLSTVEDSAQYISMQLLPNGNVFIAHSGTSGYFYLYAMICTINGATVIAGTDTRLSSSRYSAYGVSTELLSNGNIFISHSSSSSDYYLYAMICSVDGTTITKGTDTKLGTDYNTGNISSTVLLKNGNMFVAHSGVDYYLYAIICTIDGTTITAGTDKKLINSSKSAYRLSIELLPSGNVFIAHSWGSSYYLYGTVCSIDGTTITAGTPTSLVDVSYAGYEISTELLSNGKVFIAHSHTQSNYYLYGMVVTINDKTITKGIDTVLDGVQNTAQVVSTLLLWNETILVAHTGEVNNVVYAQIWDIDESNNIPTNQIVAMGYEQQVTLATEPPFDGIALSNGVGGTDTAHNEQVKVCAPKSVIYTGDIIPKSWTAITEGTEYISSNGTILSANGTDNATWSVDKACDGNTGTLVRFLSNNRTWIKLKFPKNIKITKMSLWCGNTTTTTTVYIQGSNNDTDWNNLCTISKFTDSQGVQELVDLNNTDYYLYYRIYIPEADTNFIYEWQTSEYEVIE